MYMAIAPRRPARRSCRSRSSWDWGRASAGRLVDLFGARWPLIAGPSVTAVGLRASRHDAGAIRISARIFPGLVVVGIGMTISVAPLTTVVLNSASNDQSGIVSGIDNAVARAAGLVAVAALGLAFGGASQRLRSKGRRWPSAYRLVMFVSAALAVLSAMIAAVTISLGEKRPGEKLLGGWILFGIVFISSLVLLILFPVVLVSGIFLGFGGDFRYLGLFLLFCFFCGFFGSVWLGLLLVWVRSIWIFIGWVFIPGMGFLSGCLGVSFGFVGLWIFCSLLALGGLGGLCLISRGDSSSIGVCLGGCSKLGYYIYMWGYFPIWLLDFGGGSPPIRVGRVGVHLGK